MPLSLLPFGIDDSTAALAATIQESVVQVRSRQGAGSGIIWSADGLVVTNSHVMTGDNAEIELTDGRIFQGSLVERDARNDLAVIRLGLPVAVTVPAAVIGDSRGLRVGQLVFAVGHPMGLKNVLTAGIVSELEAGDERRQLIRADITLRPGNSGGPLVDAEGRVLGVNAMVASPGVALAVPVHLVQRLVGTQVAPKIGISGREVEFGPAVAARAGIRQTRGVLLVEIASGSTAEAAGLYPGDIVIAVNDEVVHWADRMSDALARRNPHAALSIKVLRGGAIHDLSIEALVPVASAA